MDDDWGRHEGRFGRYRSPRGLYYILGDQNELVEVDDVLEMARWSQGRRRHVGDTAIGAYRVSTVFLGINTNLFGGHPQVFETMIFEREVTQLGRELDRYVLGHRDAFDYQRRYATWVEAEQGHQEAVTFVLEQLRANAILREALGKLAL